MRIEAKERRAALIWNKVREELVPENDLVFHRIPGSSRLFSIEPEELAGEYLSLRTPNISVTWDCGGEVFFYDALLRIDRNGYSGVVENSGVIKFVVEQLLYSEVFDEKRFSATVEHIPYHENKAHAEVWFCDEKKRPDDWQKSDVIPKPPRTVRRRWRREVTGRVIDAWVQGESPIVFCPDTFIEFV